MQSPSESSSSHIPNLQPSRSQKRWGLGLGDGELCNCWQDKEEHGDAIEASRNIRVSSTLPELILLARLREESEEEDGILKPGVKVWQRLNHSSHQRRRGKLWALVFGCSSPTLTYLMIGRSNTRHRQNECPLLCDGLRGRKHVPPSHQARQRDSHHCDLPWRSLSGCQHCFLPLHGNSAGWCHSRPSGHNTSGLGQCRGPGGTLSGRCELWSKEGKQEDGSVAWRISKKHPNWLCRCLCISASVRLQSFLHFWAELEWKKSLRFLYNPALKKNS